MKLLEKYKERLHNNELQKGGYIHYTEDNTNKLLNDVKVTNFYRLYTQIAVAIFDEGFLPQSESDNIDYLRKYLEDSSNIEMELRGEIVHPNYYYGYLSRIDINYTFLISAYMHHVYNDIVEKYNDDIIYIDTDSIFHTVDLDLDYLDLKYESTSFKHLIMIAKKRYIAYPNDTSNLPEYLQSKRDDGLLIRGFSLNPKDRSFQKTMDKIDPLMRIIKEQTRKAKIDSIID